jgi:hypothetical protein
LLGFSAKFSTLIRDMHFNKFSRIAFALAAFALPLATVTVQAAGPKPSQSAPTGSVDAQQKAALDAAAAQGSQALANTAASLATADQPDAAAIAAYAAGLSPSASPQIAAAVAAAVPSEAAAIIAAVSAGNPSSAPAIASAVNSAIGGLGGNTPTSSTTVQTNTDTIIQSPSS